MRYLLAFFVSLVFLFGASVAFASPMSQTATPIPPTATPIPPTATPVYNSSGEVLDVLNFYSAFVVPEFIGLGFAGFVVVALVGLFVRALGGTR